MSLNRLLPFVFENQVAHGALVRVGSGVDALLGHRNYSPAVRALVAQAMAAMPLLTTHMPVESCINLQFQGEGQMKLLVSQVDHLLNVRAMAQAPDDLSGSFTELLSGGVLVLMLEPRGDSRPATQASVRIRGVSLSEALETYFEQSEQLPTLIRLAAQGDRIGGFMLQRLPLQSAKGTLEDWEHLLMLATTLTDQELLDTDPQLLLSRLFAQEALRTFEPREVHVGCRCSPPGISTLLLSLGREEVDSIVKEQGRVAITCEFCGREYLFNPQDVSDLFAAATAQPAETRH